MTTSPANPAARAATSPASTVGAPGHDDRDRPDGPDVRPGRPAPARTTRTRRSGRRGRPAAADGPSRPGRPTPATRRAAPRGGRRRASPGPSPGAPVGIGRRPATNPGSASGFGGSSVPLMSACDPVGAFAGRSTSGGQDGSAVPGSTSLDRIAVPAPAARDLLDRLVEDLDLLDGELAAHREVVERPGPARGHDVEPGEVAARRAAVAGRAVGACRRRGGGIGRGSRRRRWRSESAVTRDHGSRAGATARLPVPNTRSLECPPWHSPSSVPSTSSTPRSSQVTFVVLDVETTGGSPDDVLAHRGGGGPVPRR